MLLAKYGVEDWAGRGAGFRDFLRLSSAKENRSNRRTLPVTIYGVDPSEVARGVRLRLVICQPPSQKASFYGVGFRWSPCSEHSLAISFWY